MALRDVERSMKRKLTLNDYPEVRQNVSTEEQKNSNTVKQYEDNPEKQQHSNTVHQQYSITEKQENVIAATQQAVNTPIQHDRTPEIPKKCKVTIYISEERLKKLNEICSRKVFETGKQDKSLLMEKAIDLLYEDEKRSLSP
jgi:hypothetical protein